MKKLNLLLLNLLVVVSAFAQEVRIEGFYYKIDFATKTAVVINSIDTQQPIDQGFSGKLEIPKSVKYCGEKCKVVGLDKEAFANSRGVTSIEIPSTVTSIGDRAFSGCSELTSIDIPNSVISIGANVFSDCPKLAHVKVPKSVTMIDIGAFTGSSITTLEVHGSNPNYSSVNNVLFNKDKTTLIACMPAMEGRFEIPNTVTSIASHAFAGSKITGITIPESMTDIGFGAFKDCDKLAAVIVPNAVQKLPSFIFSGCSSLTLAKVPDTIQEIPENAFLGCASLASFEIPNNVTKICTNAFCGSGLTYVSIGNAVKTIEADAFKDCSLLTKVKINSRSVFSRTIAKEFRLSRLFGKQVLEYIIGENIDEIGTHAFEECTNLRTITIPDNVNAIRIGAFEGCTSLESVVIPGSVRSVEADAFKGCTSLKSAIMKQGVRTIDNTAFYKCSALSNVVIPSTVTMIGDFAFNECDNLQDVDIPSSVTKIGKMAFPYHIRPNTVPDITNEFLGLTLGVTTKQQAIRTLLSRGEDIRINERKQLHVDNVTIGGMHFENVILNFYQGVFSSILCGNDDGRKNFSDKEYYQLVSYYTGLYSMYRYYFFDSKYVYFDDDVTSLLITKRSLFFTDKKQSKKESKAQEERNREIHPYSDTRISRSVLGCTIGTSTKEQVTDALKALDIHVVKDLSPDSIVFSGVTHEGIRFDVVTAQFCKGKLMSLKFSNPGKQLSQSEFDALDSHFHSLYAAYDTYDPDDEQADKNIAMYDDDAMRIGMSKDILQYIDCELSDKYYDWQCTSLRGKTIISPDKQHLVNLFKSLDKQLPR